MGQKARIVDAPRQSVGPGFFLEQKSPRGSPRPRAKHCFLSIGIGYAESRLWTVLLAMCSLLAIARTLNPSPARRDTFSRSTINRGRPNVLPWRLARLKPAFTRSTIRLRSNSA